jgi:phage terminase large subunit-like protein
MPAVPFPFDWAHPDYVKVFEYRAARIRRIRADPTSLPYLKHYYRENPTQFIIDWGVTFDPRNVEIGLPSKIPFVPFPKQIDWLEWVLARWKCRERGITEKSRGAGVSWLAVSLAATLCLFNRGMVVGFGSRKAEYVDSLGDPKSLFFKARMFLKNLPVEFRCGWDEKLHAREMRILFPETDSAMTGESGDSIGRGDRTSLYFVDEAAFLEHPDVAEGSLSDTTNCRIDISTSNGALNAFYDRRISLPEWQVFTLHFRDDPRRDAEWELKKRAEVAPAIFDREYDISYDEGGSFFAEESLLVKGADGEFHPIEMPRLVGAVFAVIDTAVKSGKEHDGCAVVYCARSTMGNNFPLTILDWDYKQIDGALLEVWLPNVFETLEKFAKECQAFKGSVGCWIEDKQSGSVLIQQAKRKKLKAFEIDSKLTGMGKSERAINASGPVHRGEVKVTRRAYERRSEFKGVTKNHFMMQVLGFRAGDQTNVQDDCLDCFSYSIALGLGNRAGF